MQSNKQLQKAISELRHNLNLSQTEFASKVGVSAMSVSRWEAGKNPPPAECVIMMAKLSGNSERFWFFLRQVGLSKNDVSRYR